MKEIENRGLPLLLIFLAKVVYRPTGYPQEISQFGLSPSFIEQQ